MKSMLPLFALSLVLIASSGCSFFGTKEQEVTVLADPADAKVMINGDMYTSPVKKSFCTSNDLTVSIMKDGYEPVTAKCISRYSYLGQWDLAGGGLFLLPWIGLFSDGAYELSNRQIVVQLRKKDW